MCQQKQPVRHVTAVLATQSNSTDGAESFVAEAVKSVVESHGKVLTPEAMHASSGRRPLEAWQAVKDILDIDATAQQLFDESEPILTDRQNAQIHTSLLLDQCSNHGMASEHSFCLTEVDEITAYSNLSCCCQPLKQGNPG